MADLTDAELESLCICGEMAAAEVGDRDGEWYAATCERHMNLVERIVAARVAAERERVLAPFRALADDLDDLSDECRAKHPQNGRWIGRAVAYGASSTKVRAAIKEATDE